MGIAIACAVLLALPLAATAAAYAAGRDRGTSGAEALGLAGTTLAFAQEWLATTALLAVWPWRLSRPARFSAPRGVVVFIPERHCSSAAFWYLRRRLRVAGWESVAGLERTRRRDAAAVLAALDARIAALPTGTALVLLGHGLGGRLALAYAAARPRLGIRQTVTLGTPHRGSMALPYRVLGIDPASAPPMPIGPEIDLVALYSDFDAWLQPIDDAYCPGGFTIAISGIGHCAMLLSRRVADLLVENLGAAIRPSV